MKTSTILLSVALAFRTIYSKAVYYHSKAISEQLSIPEEDSSFELVESRNFIYKLHCSEEKNTVIKLKKIYISLLVRYPMHLKFINQSFLKYSLMI